MSQEDFMRKDECLLLDERDRVVGQASKQACHRFSLEQVRWGWVDHMGRTSTAYIYIYILIGS